MSHFENLRTKLRERSAVIGVVGLGYVGLPLAMRYAEVGFRTVGFDIVPAKIERLKAGQSLIDTVSDERVRGVLGSSFEPTSDFARAHECDALIICVPTPLDKHREPDLRFVIDTTDALVPHMRAGQVLSLESTTYPGTTEEELAPRLEAAGLAIGKEVFLVYSPEREDPGNRSFNTQTIPKVCGGTTKACLEIGVALYDQIIDRVVPVSSTRAAELTKLLENIHRAVNIGLVNEMKVVADRMGIDIYEVIEAAATKPFGFVPYYPGPGLGGHCIPIDPFYLTWKAREFGVHTKFIELAGEVNSAMPDYVMGKVAAALNSQSKALNGSRVLVLGIAYKKNVDDMRESPAVVLMEKLRAAGSLVDYSDPHVPVFPTMREHRFDLTSVQLTETAVASYDCLLLATDHDRFDYELILHAAQLMVDTRGRYRGENAKVIRA